MAVRTEQYRAALSDVRRRPGYLHQVQLRAPKGEVLEFDLGAQLTIISGRNGGGKTTLVRDLARMLGSEDSSGLLTEPPVCTGTGAGQVRDQTFQVSLPSEVEYPGMSRFVDISHATSEIANRLRSDTNYRDLLEGVGASWLETEFAAYILGREYELILVREITDLDADDQPTPFFEVMAHDVSYNSLQMGRGEHCLLYLLWILESVPPQSILLLEEPEAHLAGYSQSRLIEVLAHVAKKKKLHIILTTHSPAMALSAGVPVHFVNRLPTWSLVTETDTGAASRLGWRFSAGLGLFFEDRVAQEFGREIIRRLSPGLLNRCSFFTLDSGESGIARLISDVKARPRNDVSLLFVLDGDQRSKSRDDSSLFLPGDVAPEAVLRNAWKNRVGAGGATDVDDVDMEGLEGHAWFKRFAENNGGYEAATRILVGAVMEDRQLRDQAQRFTSNVTSLLPPS